MGTITLEQIETEHSRVGALIEQFRKQSIGTECVIDRVVIPLASGEKFAGAILNEDGTLRHYLIKLPGEDTDANHGRARKYASEQGGSLPTKQESNLLRANLRGEFADAAYWLDEEYEGDSSYAWYQHFDNGTQSLDRKSAALRAVAVRRFIPSVI